MLSIRSAAGGSALDLGALTGSLVIRLPIAVVLLVGLILIATRGRRLAGRAKALALAPGAACYCSAYWRPPRGPSPSR